MVKHLQAKHRGWFLLSVGSSGRSEAVKSTLGQESAVGWSVLQPNPPHTSLLLHPLLNITLFLLSVCVSFCVSPCFFTITSVSLLVILTLPSLSSFLSPHVSPSPPFSFVFVKGAQAHPPPLWPFVTPSSDSRIQGKFVWLGLLVCS